MEVLQTAQCFGLVAGQPQFLYTKVIHKLGDDLYTSRTLQRILTGSKEVDMEELSQTTAITIEGYCPRYTSNMTKAPIPLAPNCYVKRPNLMAYEQELGVHQYVHQDISACEILRTHPHTNVATYYGCEVSNGRVISLCFRKYGDTLMERVNPQHLTKQHGTNCDSQVVNRYMNMITDGVSHIHSFGIAHNDINPNNIMFDEEDTLVIIDYQLSLVIR